MKLCDDFVREFDEEMLPQEVIGRLRALADFREPHKLGPEPQRAWRAACHDAANIIERSMQSESGLSVAPMMLPPEQFDAAKERALCDWPTGRFRLFDDPDPHKPCYLVCPDGATVGFSHHDGNGVDKARVQFIVDACNVALSKHSAIETTSYRQVGWAQIELRATQGGMLYEVAGSVSDERTEHHTEPVYIAVVEAADRKIDHG